MEADTSIKKIRKALGEYQNKAPNVYVKAANDTAMEARRLLIATAKKTYEIQALKVSTKSLEIKRAKKTKLQAELTIKGKVNDLFKFKTSPAKYNPEKRPKVVKARVLKSSSLKIVDKSAFLAKFKSGHVSIMKRKGKSRLPIKSFYGPSLPNIIKNEKVYGKISPEIENILQKHIKNETQKMLDREAAKTKE